MALETKLIEHLKRLDLPLSVVLPNGATYANPKGVTVQIIFEDNRALIPFVTGNVGQIAGDYIEGRIKILGTMRSIMEVAAGLLTSNPTKFSILDTIKSSVLNAIHHRSAESDARNIEFHYDVSDEFYKLWLDPQRVYSCAYFREPNLTLAEAQTEKLDLICRKLMLRKGERFLDIGAGWGALLFHAAEHYGVKAQGVTLSKNQYAYVNDEIARRGLDKQVKMLLLDYRELQAKYDKIASVGMFEHVGRKNLPTYFAQLNRLLNPGGLILNHGITAGGVENRSLSGGMGDFISKYIFPGGELQHISHVLQVSAEAGLETLDVDNLRPHYAKTLWAWSDNLEDNLAQAVEVTNQRTVRIYRMYLAGCAMGFEHGWTSLNQVLLTNSTKSTYPFVRDYMYPYDGS